MAKHKKVCWSGKMYLGTRRVWLAFFAISFGLICASGWAIAQGTKAERDAMANWVAQAQQSVKARLRDPDSVRWGEIYFSRGSLGAPAVCGSVNSKNGFGGYSGEHQFISVNRQHTYFPEDVKPGEWPDLWNQLCASPNAVRFR